MFLVELVMQGVRGIRELARLRFQSGFNLVAAGNESGKTTAVDAVQRLLFPNSDPSAMNALISRHTPDSSRGALVVCSDEGAYYRVIQDFSKRAVNLSKYNSSSKEFSLLHKDWEQARQFMDGLTAAVSEEDYARIFLLRREQTADGGGCPASVPAATQLQPAKTAAPAGRTSAANQAKAAELREMLRKAEEAADADYRYQAAKLALAEIKKKLSSLEEVEQKKAELEANLAELKGCEHLPENLSELLENHERRQSQKLAEADDLNKELEVLQMQHASVPATNILIDKLFISGVVIGALSLLAGMFVLTAEYGHFFYIGLIVALVLVAAALYSGSRKNAQRRIVKQDIEALEKDIADLEKKFAQESAAVTIHMRAAGAATPAELKERSENFRYFGSLRADLEEQRQRILGNGTAETLREEHARDQEEAAKLEQAARAIAQNNIDTYSIRQDIERLEGEASPAAAAWDFGAAEQDAPVSVASIAPPAVLSQGGVLAELSVASRVGGIETETLIPAVEAAAQRNISAVTNGKYVRIEVGQDGEPVVHTKDNERISYRDLSHGTKALVTFCLRTGLVEAIVGKRRLPFVLDDALAGFDHARQQAACQILRALGTKTQVILFTSNPSLKATGDAAAELK
ncbi:MAG: AAA family ATPase [Nitrospiraceae bacterium]|nr:AAA family ATPase [Nitrospiraceae bacterium]